jgi:hypothetical protein
MNKLENSNQAKKIQTVEFLQSNVATSYEEVSRSLESEKDVLFQFRSNLQQLEDLAGRLKFVLGEVRHNIKRR